MSHYNGQWGPLNPRPTPREAPPPPPPPSEEQLARFRRPPTLEEQIGQLARRVAELEAIIERR